MAGRWEDAGGRNRGNSLVAGKVICASGAGTALHGLGPFVCCPHQGGLAGWLASWRFGCMLPHAAAGVRRCCCRWRSLSCCSLGCRCCRWLACLVCEVNAHQGENLAPQAHTVGAPLQEGQDRPGGKGQ